MMRFSDVRFKFLFKPISLKNKDPKVLLLAATQDRGIIPKSEVGYRTVTIAEENYEGLKVVKKGNFCITLRSFQGGIEYSEFDGGISSGYTVLSLRQGNNHTFFKYYLKNICFIASLNKYKISIRDGQNIPFSDLSDEIISIPLLSQQIAIANYLDIETSKIDKKIDILSQKVDKLEEYKQSIIFETVTKGLDNSVLMKDSGIEWIGDIPTHWEVKRVKEIFNYLGKSDMPSGDGELVGIYDFYVSGNKLKKSNKTNLNTAALLLPTGGTYIVHFPKNIPCAYSTDVLPLTTVSLNINYGYYFLISNKKYFDQSYFSGMGIKHLQREDFFNSMITIPTKGEQIAIANFLDIETSKIDKQKELIKKKIELLKEYKQSLIYEAVTGKISIK